ncbi:MAG: SDR family oxidoreductase [Acidimicrobiia bacterium]|jgi:NAD(P)-dependent dehydrogenase (short-subunit alcohol dehydrogenase family)
MGFDPQGQRVLLTGASSGIGAALAERLAAEGAILGLVGRNEERLAATLERCRVHSPESRMWTCDLADFGALDVLAATAIAELGGVDVLINNAGIPKHKGVLDIDPDTVDLVMRVNYVSPVRLTLRLLPHMVERGSGRIVMVSSVAATLSSPGEGAYDASKSALSVFSEAMAIDLWDLGVKVHIVYPGVVDTPLFLVPDNDPLSPEIEKIPVAEFVDGMMTALRADALQAYIPQWFEDIAKGKAQNVAGFLEGSANWIRQQNANG